jgi:hypothetical protein
MALGTNVLWPKLAYILVEKGKFSCYFLASLGPFVLRVRKCVALLNGNCSSPILSFFSNAVIFKHFIHKPNPSMQDGVHAMPVFSDVKANLHIQS